MSHEKKRGKRRTPLHVKIKTLMHSRLCFDSRTRRFSLRDTPKINANQKKYLWAYLLRRGLLNDRRSIVANAGNHIASETCMLGMQNYLSTVSSRPFQWSVPPLFLRNVCELVYHILQEEKTHDMPPCPYSMAHNSTVTYVDGQLVFGPHSKGARKNRMNMRMIFSWAVANLGFDPRILDLKLDDNQYSYPAVVSMTVFVTSLLRAAMPDAVVEHLNIVPPVACYKKRGLSKRNKDTIEYGVYMA